MYLPASPAARKREEENRIRARLAAMDGRITALVALGVGAEASILAFTHADVDEVGKALVEGKVRLPIHARIAVETTVTEQRSRVFGNSTILTHTCDQLCAHQLQPMSIPAAIEAGLLAKVSGQWLWREDVYRKLVPPDPRLTP
jgi:hypothetical protein